MKPLLSAITLLLIACTIRPSQTKPPGRQLVWSDEFNRDGHPDSTKWSYETGFVRNREIQYYTHDRPQNARIENGHLIIEARKESYNAALYTSASLITLGQAAWQYGRIGVRAMLPQGRGIWPAIWMLGENFPVVGWPACGEIDILEFVGPVHATVHHGPSPERHTSADNRMRGDDLHARFHLYSLEWKPDTLEIAFDRKPYFTYTRQQADPAQGWPFDRPFYLILNTAVGGTWGGPVDDSIFPQQFVIDYVRVYN